MDSSKAAGVSNSVGHLVDRGNFTLVFPPPFFHGNWPVDSALDSANRRSLVRASRNVTPSTSIARSLLEPRVVILRRQSLMTQPRTRFANGLKVCSTHVVKFCSGKMLAIPPRSWQVRDLLTPASPWLSLQLDSMDKIFFALAF